jgi:hypothetical protein
MIAFWERIPFLILKEYESEKLIPENVSLATTIFHLWNAGEIIESSVDKKWKNIYDFENGQSVEVPTNHPLSQLKEIINCKNVTPETIHKKVVIARQLLQTVEKFMFIMTKVIHKNIHVQSRCKDLSVLLLKHTKF